MENLIRQVEELAAKAAKDGWMLLIDGPAEAWQDTEHFRQNYGRKIEEMAGEDDPDLFLLLLDKFWRKWEKIQGN